MRLGKGKGEGGRGTGGEGDKGDKGDKGDRGERNILYTLIAVDASKKLYLKMALLTSYCKMLKKFNKLEIN
ncbi:MAG: hypothetical protein KME31_35710 [Tolypothrix carrinoi HA7290-LM1]|nr:hypothetical protein [Tolypothrix carrinoi HA7290-LM1]